MPTDISTANYLSTGIYRPFVALDVLTLAMGVGIVGTLGVSVMGAGIGVGFGVGVGGDMRNEVLTLRGGSSITSLTSYFISSVTQRNSASLRLTGPPDGGRCNGLSSNGDDDSCLYVWPGLGFYTGVYNITK